MATYTVKLNVTKTAVIDSENPGENYSQDESYSIDDFRFICLGFEPIPDSYNGKVIRTLNPNVHFSNVEFPHSAIASMFNSNWSENGITYGNKPTEIPLGGTGTIDGSSNWAELVFSKGRGSLQEALTYGIEFSVFMANFSRNMRFYTRHSAYPPYANVKLEDVVYDVSKSKLNPTEGFVGKHIANTFSFSIIPTGEEFVGNVTPYPSQIVFRWRPLDGQATEITLPGNQSQYTIPAETFNSDQIQWQISAVSDENVHTSDWYTLTTVDSTSSAKAVSPVNVVVDGSYPVDFRWNHVIDTGSDQTKYEIEYSEDNGLEWKPLKSEETPNTFATIPENTLPAGNLLWKVRTYNSDGVAGNWSEPAGFIVRAAPQAPSITSISAEARPTVRWQSVGQEAYEIAVYSGETLLYTTGETAGTEKQKKIPEYLAPGTYTVQIRIWNAYNIESPWSSGTVQIPENVLTPPGITATTRPGVVEIQISGTGYEKYYLLRDGVPIAKILSGSYRDYAVSAGTHSYVARGVTAEDAFADSEPQEVTVSLPYAVIAPADNLAAWTPLIYRRNSEPSWTENLQSMGQAVFVAGRKKPFFESAEYWNNVLSFAFSYRTREEYDALRELLLDGKTVRYRGKDGTAYWMVITGLQTTMDYLSKDFTLSAQEVDYVEKIEYDTEES